MCEQDIGVIYSNEFDHDFGGAFLPTYFLFDSEIVPVAKIIYAALCVFDQRDIPFRPTEDQLLDMLGLSDYDDFRLGIEQLWVFKAIRVKEDKDGVRRYMPCDLRNAYRMGDEGETRKRLSGKALYCLEQAGEDEMVAIIDRTREILDGDSPIDEDYYEKEKHKNVNQRILEWNAKIYSEEK
jgi:hypothetical protein